MKQGNSHIQPINRNADIKAKFLLLPTLSLPVRAAGPREPSTTSLASAPRSTEAALSRAHRPSRRNGHCPLRLQRPLRRSRPERWGRARQAPFHPVAHARRGRAEEAGGANGRRACPPPAAAGGRRHGAGEPGAYR